MGTPEGAKWAGELERPSASFFKVFAQRCQEGEGPRGAAREAVRILTPAVDWAAYLPHVPHGLLGLHAVFRLEPFVAPASFRRMLATQIHAFAQEARAARGAGLGDIGLGSGHWPNLEMALQHHRPAIAWGEALGVEAPAPGDFRRLERLTEKDMANVGHKAVMARALGDLAADLGEPAAARTLLALSAWLGASEPFDTFWHDRSSLRLKGAPPVPPGPPQAPPELHRAAAREICDSGLVDLLDRFSARVKAAATTGDLLAMLVLAASEKQLDARRDLEGKTAWNFTFLGALARRAEEEGRGIPESWVQGAALVNLFPTGEEEDRPRPAAPAGAPGEPAAALLDAILDGEPLQAMHLCQALLAGEGPRRVLEVLAEAASVNDPVFNHSHHLLGVAAAVDLAPRLGEEPLGALLTAQAKFLANSQGSCDLGRLADGALKRVEAP